MRSMEPRIQYAKTSDGVSIAFTTMGEGEPLVLMPTPPISHVGKAATVPSLWQFLTALGEVSRLVVYDGRGFGLSDRDEPVFSIETQILDLTGVVDHLGYERFAVLGHFDSTPAAIAYASRHPERVSHLILWSGYASGAEQTSTAEFEAMIALMDKDWGVFTQLTANMAMASSLPDEIARFAEFIRASASPAVFQNAWRASAGFDVTGLLPSLIVPTLVMDRQGSRGVELSRKLAANIKQAELCLLGGADMVEWAGDMAQVVQAIERFLGAAPSAGTTEPEQASVRTVLFTDIVGHTGMMSRLGDERGREVLREHERITRGVLKQHGGTEVKTMGDGFMASFGSVTKAVECAMALQRAFAERNEGVGRSPSTGSGRTDVEPLHVRVGLNAGEPIEEEGDLFGATVILAARIAAKAEGGEILVADTVRGLCSGKGFLFADRGDFVAKGFEEPVRLFEVRWAPDSD